VTDKIKTHFETNDAGEDVAQFRTEEFDGYKLLPKARDLVSGS